MWDRSHRQDRCMCGLSSYASIWKCSRRSGSVYRSHSPNTTDQKARGLTVFVFGGAFFACAAAFESRIVFACAWISSRNQAGYSYRS